MPDIGTAVSRYLTRAAATSPGTVPLLATYRLVHGVHGNGDSPTEQQAYHDFIQRLRSRCSIANQDFADSVQFRVLRCMICAICN